MNAKELLSGESQTVEYKAHRSPNAKSYLKTVVAFANARGGTIVFGVDDSTCEVLGIPDKQVFSDADAIANAIMDSVEPQILPDITVQDVDGKSVILVEVPLGRQCPYFFRSEGLEAGVYVRVGATTRHADLDWVRELTQECSPQGFDRTVRRGYTVDNTQIETLCQRMYEVALSRAPEERRSSIRRVTQSQLITWGVLQERDGRVLPTNAFLILVGDPEVVPPLQCAIFKGASRSTFLDRRTIVGDAMAQVERAYQYVLEKMNMGADLGGVVRRDVYELPEWSVREIITNAVVHRSYVERSSVQVALYDDRLEVSSPGGIVRGFSLGRALSGQSRPRNEALAQAFLYMGLVEGWGSGIPRVLEECEGRGLRKPEFADIDGMLRVNLWRPTGEQFAAYLRGGFSQGGGQTTTTDSEATVATDRQPIATGDRTAIATGDRTAIATGDRTAIESYIRKHGEVSASEIGALLGLKPSRTREILANMVAEGKLERHGEKRYTRYSVGKGGNDE